MKQLLLLSLAALALPVQAQVTANRPDVMPQQTLTAQPIVRFGYLSYEQTLRSLPDYAIAQRNIDKLRQDYDAEMKRVEEEFNAKYETFLEGQREFAPSILKKRQAELQELMEKNVAFKEQAQQLLRNAEQEAFAPLRAQLQQAINRVALAHSFSFVLNTDNNAVPFVNPSTGVDITAEVLATLQ